MTAAELIAELQAYEPSTTVRLYTEHGPRAVGIVQVGPLRGRVVIIRGTRAV